MMRMPPSLLAACALACGSMAGAADLVVEVRDAKGAPVREAVVTAHLASGQTPAAKSSDTYEIDQRNIQFHPFVTIVPVGGRVNFLNHDPLRHHVYSFSPAKRFELKLEGRQENRSVTFDKPGIVPLGCNIHDSMIAFVAVVDTPWAAKTDASGRIVLHGVPAGALSVAVWHPWLKAPGNRVARAVTLAPGGGQQSFAVALRAPPRPPAQADY